MAKKKKSNGRPMNPARKAIKTVGSFATSALAAGPVVVPLYDGYKYSLGGQAGGVAGNDFVAEAVYSGIGFNMVTNQLDMAQVKKVAARDAIMIGGAMVLRYALKRV